MIRRDRMTRRMYPRIVLVIVSGRLHNTRRHYSPTRSQRSSSTASGVRTFPDDDGSVATGVGA